MLNRIQSALDAAGPQAARIEGLWWLMFWVSVVVQVSVVAYVAWAVHRSRQNANAGDPATDAPLWRGVAIATALTVVTLFGLLVANVMGGRAVASQRDETALVIKVTGYQWWWDVEYQHPEPAQRVRTANELHLPVGRTVAIQLVGNDVIHSFWVPNLHGKMDIIPGHINTLWLRADTPGVYRGQCAEFCGLQHARMAFTVVVESSDDFERWIQGQRTTAMQPESDLARRGLQIVQSGPCALCHQVLGTGAAARTAPDLTHVATRSTLAAGTLPNTPENRARWIADPQKVKPGSRMPTLGLSDADLRAVLAYLEVLK